MRHAEWQALKNKWEERIKEISECCKRNENHYEIQDGNIEFTDYKVRSKATGDHFGKVYEKNNIIYRVIYAEKTEEFKELWGSGLLQGLMEYRLIPQIVISGYKMENCSIVLQVERVEISPADIWTYSMVKDAALCISLIKAVSNNMGYYLIDGHSNNVTFHKGKPIMTDIGSIQKKTDRDINCAKEVVLTLCFRMLFDMIGNSLLSRKLIYNELDNSGRIFPFKNEDSKRENVNALRIFRRYHLRSGIRTQWIIHKIFDELDIRPCYIDYLFQVKEKCRMLPYAETDYSIWTEMLLQNQIHVHEMAELGSMGGELCKKIKNDNISDYVKILEYDERIGDYTYNRIKNNNKLINIYLFNYFYRTDEWRFSIVQADLICIADIWTNIYIYTPWELVDVFYALYRLTRKYVMFSYYPEQEIQNKSFRGKCKENKYLDIEVSEVKKELQKWFEIIDMKENGSHKDRYFVFLLEKKGKVL
jgi:hypothetical protein